MCPQSAATSLDPFSSCTSGERKGNLPMGEVCLQSISFRDAFYNSIMADRPGFRLEDIFCDIVHPNAMGHR